MSGAGIGGETPVEDQEKDEDNRDEDNKDEDNKDEDEEFTSTPPNTVRGPLPKTAYLYSTVYIQYKV